MKYIPLKQFPKYKENPFLDEAIENILIVKKRKFLKQVNGDTMHYIVNNDGEVEAQAEFLSYILVDEERFIKGYPRSNKIWFDIGVQGQRVFRYITEVLKPNKDKFIFKMSECLEYTEYKGKNLITCGLSQLVMSGIIARTPYNYEFHINPLVFFNGNRVTYVKQKIKNKVIIKQNQLEIPFDNLEQSFMNPNDED